MQRVLEITRWPLRALKFKKTPLDTYVCAKHTHLPVQSAELPPPPQIFNPGLNPAYVAECFTKSHFLFMQACLLMTSMCFTLHLVITQLPSQSTTLWEPVTLKASHSLLQVQWESSLIPGPRLSPLKIETRERAWYLFSRE